MRSLFTTFSAIILCLSLNCCTSNNTKTKEKNPSSFTPDFSDNGKLIDSLKAVYNFEGVEYENWEEDDATDSTLTVLFINSKKLPAKSIDSTVHEFKAIASGIHKSVVNADKYNSYYIIFVATDTVGIYTNRAHSAGMEVSVNQF